jgi:hypothetical protein
MLGGCLLGIISYAILLGVQRPVFAMEVPFLWLSEFTLEVLWWVYRLSKSML